MVRDRTLFARIWRDYLRDHWPAMAVVAALMVIEGGTLGVLSWMLKPLFDRVFVGGDTGAIWWVGGVIFSLFVIRAVTSVASKALLTGVQTATAAAMQTDLLGHVLRLDQRWFQDNPPGAVIERIQGDTLAVQGLWTTIISGAGRDAVSLLALFGVAIAIDPVWTAAAVVGVPLLVVPMALVQRYVRRKMRGARIEASARATRLDEVLHGIRAVRLNGMEPDQTARFAAIVGRIRRAEVKVAMTGATIPALIDIVTGIGFVGVLALGGAEVTRGERSIGDFMAFFSALSLAFQPLRRLGAIAGVWQTAAASLERIYAVLDTVPTVRDGPRTDPPPGTAIAFDDVHLAYGGVPVLRGLSFAAAEGKTTALVGASGAGKTTVFSVLTRLVDPDAGTVTVGGVPVTAFTLSTLRAQFGVVAQETALFDETIAENIRMGRPDAPPAAVAGAVAAAHVAEFADRLPAGLDTPAGPRGSALSGGQRQRVAIARAILRDAPILLLDEATSALDTASERAVQDALARLSDGRTTLVIAHRLSTIQGADHIVVLDAGRVAESGTHAQLMAAGGVYARLVALQFAEG